MPVIINDFNVETGPPAPAGQPQGQPPARGDERDNQPHLRPEDLERLTRRLMERRWRLAAD